MGALIRTQSIARNVELIGPIGTSKLESLLEFQNVRVSEFELPWCVFSPGPRSFRSLCAQQRQTVRCKIWLARWLRNKKVKLVYSNSSTILWGAWIAKRMKAKHVWHLREFGDLDYNLHLKMSKSKFNHLLRQADSIVCVSQSIAKHFAVEALPKTEVIFNGVLPLNEIGQLRQKKTQTSKTFRFGMIGFMAPGKGFETGIRALSRLKERGIIAELRIYGNGSPSLQAELHRLADLLSVSHQIRFLGYLESPRVIFDEIDCLVVASTAEAFGRTTAEAMCYGVPVIGRATAGTAELIEDRVTGLLFQETDADLAASMAELCENPSLMGTLAQAAAEFAKINFPEEVYTARFNAIVERLLSQ